MFRYRTRRKRFQEGRCYECGQPREIFTWCKKCATKMAKKAAKKAAKAGKKHG